MSQTEHDDVQVLRGDMDADEVDHRTIFVVHEESGARVMVRMSFKQVDGEEDPTTGELQMDFFFHKKDSDRLSDEEKDRIVDEIEQDFERFIREEDEADA